jgi:uncharacterized RDD family membrane protein YckC
MSTTTQSFASGSGSSCVLAGRGIRIGAYVIDAIPAFFMWLLIVIPFIGPFLAGLLLTPYWLLRDVMGGSLGKVLLGLRVVAKDGQPATKGALVGRNLPLVIGPAMLVIPFLGYVFGPGAALVCLLLEIISLLATGERLGDKMAGTVVVRK